MTSHLVVLRVMDYGTRASDTFLENTVMCASLINRDGEIHYITRISRSGLYTVLCILTRSEWEPDLNELRKIREDMGITYHFSSPGESLTCPATTDSTTTRLRDLYQHVYLCLR